jgi:hypothetical protein
LQYDLLALLDDLSNNNSFIIKSQDSLDLSDNENFVPDYDNENEDDQEVLSNRQFTLEYIQKVVNFARPGISFATVQH